MDDDLKGLPLLTRWWRAAMRKRPLVEPRTLAPPTSAEVESWSSGRERWFHSAKYWRAYNDERRRKEQRGWWER